MGPVMSAVSNGLSPGHTAHDTDTKKILRLLNILILPRIVAV